MALSRDQWSYYADAVKDMMMSLCVIAQDACKCGKFHNVDSCAKCYKIAHAIDLLDDLESLYRGEAASAHDAIEMMNDANPSIPIEDRYP